MIADLSSTRKNREDFRVDLSLIQIFRVKYEPNMMSMGLTLDSNPSVSREASFKYYDC